MSQTLQGKDTTIQEAVNATDLAIRYLTRLRSDTTFVDFYSKVVENSKELTSDPVLPRYRRPPQRIDDGEAPVHFSDAKSYFKQQYFEILDLLVNELKRRFQQKRGLPVMSILEKVLLDSVNNTFCSSELPEEFAIYKSDLDLSRLKVQLSMLPDLIATHNTNSKIPIKKVTNVRTICDVIKETSTGKEMFSEIIKMLKIFYTLPVTTSTAERSFSALRRLKTFLRSTMTQDRLNHTLITFIHKERTDTVDEKDIAKVFISANDKRRKYFGNV